MNATDPRIAQLVTLLENSGFDRPAADEAHGLLTRIDATAAWPEGVIARYLAVGGATVDLTEYPDEIVGTCSGGCDKRRFDYDPTCTGSRWEGWARKGARTWAQEHAEVCRAMPSPA